MVITIAIRNLLRHKRRTLFALFLIAFGLAGYIFFTSFMRAFGDDMVESSVRVSYGHIRLHNEQYKQEGQINLLRNFKLPDVDNYEAISKRLHVSGMAATSSRNTGVQIYGVDFDNERVFGDWDNRINQGDFRKIKPGSNGAVIGRALADELKTKIGRRLVLYGQDASGETAAYTFRVRAILDLGSPEVDGVAVFVDHGIWSETLKIPGVYSELRVLLPDADMAGIEAWIAEAEKRWELPNDKWEWQHWQQAAPPLAQMIEQMNSSLIIYLILIVFAIIAGIFDTLMIAVYERFYEIGVLRSIGFSRSKLGAMILIESLLTGLIGVGMGVGIGVLIVSYYGANGLDLSGFGEGIRFMGIRPILHLRIASTDLINGAGIVFLSVGVASFLPMIQAVRRKPLELMRDRNF